MHVRGLAKSGASLATGKGDWDSALTLDTISQLGKAAFGRLAYATLGRCRKFRQLTVSETLLRNCAPRLRRPFRIFRILQICGSESSFASLIGAIGTARIDSVISDQCVAIHSGIYLDSIILINHH